MIVILGAGMTGLSCSYHLGHDRCLVLEGSERPFGHIASHARDGFTWDQGPHVSFTKHAYVRNLFEEAVGGERDEFPARIGNFFQGHWIDHPAQMALHQVPEPLRQQCLDSFLATRAAQDPQAPPPANYRLWLEAAFGPVFARTFPEVYTRKYWTMNAEELTTEWVGPRIPLPRVQDVIDGSRGPLEGYVNYINRVRYPRAGGYQAFAEGLARGCHLRLNARVVRIDLKEKRLWLADGECVPFRILINTLPLPVFMGACVDVPAPVQEAVEALACSQLHLVDITSPRLTSRPENWIYVYDPDILSTRLHFTEKLTPGNAPAGCTGVQVEVYAGREKPLALGGEALALRVVDELVHMGVLDASIHADLARGEASASTRFLPWANVIFHHPTRSALEVVWRWLEGFGLERRDDDTHPVTSWAEGPTPGPSPSTLFMGGRYGQWKYFWSDDCLLRGREIAAGLPKGTPCG